MKKLIFTVTAAILLTPTVFAASESRLSYEPSGGLVITSPNEEARESYYYSAISFLGACDPLRPLYINGDEVPVTVNGFFAYYAEGLQIGENAFTLTNGVNEETVVINRKTPEPVQPAETIYYEQARYASTDGNMISRFYDGDDDDKMGTPLAKGTVFRLTGERGDMYILSDGSYVFKSNAYTLDYNAPVPVIDGFELNGDTARFKLNVNALYSVELDGNQARVTFYGLADGEKTFNIELGFEPTGYYAEFRDGYLYVRFPRKPEHKRTRAVIIDAGHGGADPGAFGPPGEFGPMEKDINAYTAGKTREYLERRGVNVIFPREGDETTDIYDRIALFTEKPELSVCIHSNSAALNADYSKTRGMLMFYTLGLSEETADGFIRHISEASGNEYTPPVKRNFAMARYTGAPSMLFEMGYVCNPEEYEKLISTDYLDKIAAAVGEAVIEYLGELPEEEVTEAVSETAAEITGADETAETGALTEPEPQLPEPGKAFSADTTISVILGVIAAGAVMLVIESKLI